MPAGVLDITPFAPTVLRKVNLGPGNTDLGHVNMNRGASLIIREPGENGTTSFLVRVTSLGAPPYRRWLSAQAFKSEARLRGLGKGSFLISINGRAG